MKKVMTVMIISFALLLTMASAFALIVGPFTKEQADAASHDPVFYNELGFKMASENPQAAQAAFAHAVAIDPSYERARYNLATIAFQNGDYTAAIEQLRTLVAAHPENENYHFDLAQNLASQARYIDADLDKLREAASEFDKASNVPHATENAQIVRAVLAAFA